MYKIQDARVKLSNFISTSKFFLKTSQMLICLFPSKDFYALHTFLPTPSSSLSLLSVILGGTAGRAV